MKKEFVSVPRVLRGRTVQGGLSNMGKKKKKPCNLPQQGGSDASSKPGSNPATPEQSQRGSPNKINVEGFDTEPNKQVTDQEEGKDKTKTDEEKPEKIDDNRKSAKHDENGEENKGTSNDANSNKSNTLRGGSGDLEGIIDEEVRVFSHSKNPSNTDFTGLKGPNENDLKSPSMGESINLKESYSTHPSETREDYLTRWFNKHKIPGNASSAKVNDLVPTPMSYAKVVQEEKKEYDMSQKRKS